MNCGLKLFIALLAGGLLTALPFVIWAQDGPAKAVVERGSRERAVALPKQDVNFQEPATKDVAKQGEGITERTSCSGETFTYTYRDVKEMNCQTLGITASEEKEFLDLFEKMEKATTDEERFALRDKIKAKLDAINAREKQELSLAGLSKLLGKW